MHLRSPDEKALELQRVQQVKAELAAYEVELVAAFAADRPASLDRQLGEPGAAAADDDAAPDGISEFFADELALTLNCARASASTLTEHALTLTRSLTATLGELAQGRLDWPRARTLSEELSRPARAPTRRSWPRSRPRCCPTPPRCPSAGSRPGYAPS